MAQSSSASATASTAPDSDYDVFISHRGPDVKKTFASHLYRSLKSHGLRVFLDQPELQRGEYLIPQIEAAIRSASVHVAIFSKGYAESTWCLQELVSMLESNFPVIPVFYKVKPAELRWTRGKEGGYAKALEELEKKTTADPDTGLKKWRYETSLIKKWRNALSQAADISGFELEACNGDEGELLDNVVEGVLKKVKKPALAVSSAPLLQPVLAAAMKGKTSVNDWPLALCPNKSMDPTFLRYSGIERGLYCRLKWGYDCLPDSVLKNCFLYCATFPEDCFIAVDRLVEKWIGEGLVKSRETSYLMDLGLTYVDLLVERCLFQSFYDEYGYRQIRVHEVVYDLARYIAENEEQSLFRTRQNLPEFPASKKGIHNCKRIAIGYNNISDLPTDFSCPNLLYLGLERNESLREVPDGFLVNLTSLRVLDLCGTKIESLPMSLWHLTQLQYLGLDGTLIKDVPEDICSLSQLQFLYLNHCKNLESLPPKIRELQNLKTLNLSFCCSLTGIPREISQLTSLNTLLLCTSETVKNSIMEVEEVKTGVCTLKDLTSCSNLVQLEVHVKAGIEVEGIRAGIKMGIMGSWLEMRDLILMFDVEEHDVVEDLPRDMQSMKKLQRFYLQNYHGRSLPNCIAEFPQLERLSLWRCFQLRDLPPLERLPNLRSLSLYRCTKLKELGIGAWGSVRGFPMLESLRLEGLPMLESLGSSSSDIVWNEQSLPKLKVLTIKDCPSLKGLPRGIDKLPDLETIEVQQNWWEKNDVEIFLKEKLHHSIVFYIV